MRYFVFKKAELDVNFPNDVPVCDDDIPLVIGEAKKGYEMVWELKSLMIQDTFLDIMKSYSLACFINFSRDRSIF